MTSGWAIELWVTTQALLHKEADPAVMERCACSSTGTTFNFWHLKISRQWDGDGRKILIDQVHCVSIMTSPSIPEGLQTFLRHAQSLHPANNPRRENGFAKEFQVFYFLSRVLNVIEQSGKQELHAQKPLRSSQASKHSTQGLELKRPKAKYR